LLQKPFFPVSWVGNSDTPDIAATDLTVSKFFEYDTYTNTTTYDVT